MPLPEVTDISGKVCLAPGKQKFPNGDVSGTQRPSFRPPFTQPKSFLLGPAPSLLGKQLWI